MSSEYKYEVRGYRYQEDVRNGSQVEVGCDTVKEGKTRARFVISQSEMRQSETSQPLGYSQLVQRYTGEVVADFFNPSICQQCGHWHKGQSSFHCHCQCETAPGVEINHDPRIA